TSAIDETTSAKASRASAARRLFRNDVLKGSPANDRKERVVKGEEPHVARRVVGHARPHASDDDRNRERQEEERQQKLPCAAGRRHGREERPDCRDADVREDDPGHHRAVNAAEEEAEGGESDELGKREEGEYRKGLAEPDRTAIARCEDEPVDDALLPLGGEGAREAEECG